MRFFDIFRGCGRNAVSPENVGVAIELKRQKGGRVTPEQTAAGVWGVE